VLPAGDPYVPVGGIFRVDVPNGKYRFVAAVGDSMNPHAHRILVEDGGSGPSVGIGPNHVVLVRNFDQSQYSIGEIDALERGQGVYARVGFDCRIPPPGDGAVPSPRFVNMDRSGKATAGRPDSPELAVTQGYLRVHQLQANSNAGPGSSDPDANGSDLVVLELWRTGTVTCPEGGDTHCKGISVSGPAGGGPGRYIMTATAVDDRKDNASEEVRYTFRAAPASGAAEVVGPGSSNTASFDLASGEWTVSVSVDDDPACPDRAADDTCSTKFSVESVQADSKPGDCNGDGTLDISDPVCFLLYLFVNSSTPLPCGDGTLDSPSNAELLDFNGDGLTDLSDAIAGLSYLFTNGPPHALGLGCVKLAGCKEACSQ